MNVLELLNYLRFTPQFEVIGPCVNFCWTRDNEEMLQLSANLINRAVLSLRTGSPIAQVTGVIFNPNNLKIEGLYCQDRFDKRELILVHQDIREFLPNGYVVNDHDVLVEAEDLIRLKEIIDIDYQLIGKHVVTENKERIGKVSDFATEIETMMVQKIYVSQSMLKSFTGGSLSVDRSQVVETTPSKIIISELLKGEPYAATAPAS